jgi:hypothetical protein
MSVDTHLYIGNRWTVEDVANVIKSVRKQQIEADGHGFRFESCHEISFGMYQFYFESRMMFVHSQSETPLGRCILLSLGSNEHGVEIMRDIASILGGLLEIDDYSGNMEMIRGKLSDEDALQYHLKYAIINDGVEADDLDGVRQSMERWHGRVN